MNAELCKLALEKVGNPNVLVNLISRRVRQLTAGAGARPLIIDTGKMGAADIALTELVDGKMDWEQLLVPGESEVIGRKKKQRAG